MNSAASVHAQRIWRRKWLVLALTALAVALGFVSTLGAQPAYTGRVAMTVGSPNRAPDQDAVLSVGYATYFGDPAYQAKLKSSTGLPKGVTLSARTVASSPILYIEATADSPQQAQDAATKAGTAFRDEINARLRAAQDAAIAAVRKPFDDIRAANGVVSDVSLTQMQDAINRINADTSNKLIDLQLASDVVRQDPARWPTLMSYGVGGLLIGALVALVLGVVSRRLRTAGDLEQKVGVTALAVVPDESEKYAAERDRALKQVVTAVGLAAPAERAAVAIVAPEPGAGVEIVARAIADERARQGVRTILVHADLRRPSGAGVAEILAGRADLGKTLIQTRNSYLRELLPGSTGDDPFTALSRERFTRLLAQLHERADLVVVSAPPLLDAVEAQVITATAGLTVLVCDRGSTKSGPARRAYRLLEAVETTVLGAVLIDAPGRASGDDAAPAPSRAVAPGERVFTPSRGPE
ncbi:Wzz/FepE/Etk N-terminal domain-containing protein [Nocardia sp. NBC_01503]|uniref:Wzz/FepE/Etk N-terminal domain-containing protein n=1 Tax=Nocardia sp. NBC_01503 TaxID=2975997 RepID=UPI002E7B819A|nr:Wzz/FepE/Etk N-terminal domain-containing protein [Nocardia sp. NBC_01503]WTL31833.1 Wzz/FepE/Etk N-terminal domain-containing protein [Nocardia sp. NBC_01503]